MLHRIEISLKDQYTDPVGVKLLNTLHLNNWKNLTEIKTIQVYVFEHPSITNTDQVKNLAQELFVDPVINVFAADSFLADNLDFTWYVEVGFRAGVTDNSGRIARENLSLKMITPFRDNEIVASSTAFLFHNPISQSEIELITTKFLMNPLIQRMTIIHKSEWEQKKHALYSIPKPTAHHNLQINVLDCSTVKQIMDLSQNRLLALSESEASVIQKYFSQQNIQDQRSIIGIPLQLTDVELEMLAQTWSEHCKHKIFNATIHYSEAGEKTQTIHSLYKTFIKDATSQIRKELGSQDWCLSVFKDNAGVIRFNEEYAFVFKVETHNSPSALDPYGGALTGIVGVNRDSFGTGMGAQLLFNTDIFCFGPPDYQKPLPKKLLHPTRIFEGVRLGVEHGGNQSGIPTINGAILFDECFVGKPLVFCGTGALMPIDYFGQPAYEKNVIPGDLIVMCGGRIGLDGIHGATFSSIALDENSPVSAVQIGDPITQKKMFDFLWEARQEQLYHCITDNGAGGLSSSVGEMATFSNGCRLYLDKAPLKYQGLQPWEILISESQERMTLAVPPDKIERFLDLSKKLQVESTVLGEFTNSGYFEAFYKEQPVAFLEMDFLHNGLPAMEIQAQWHTPQLIEPNLTEPDHYGNILNQLLASYNICSKESVIRQYDHEVKGGSVIKPLVGINNDGPSDAAVIRPVLGSNEGLAVANGICPSYSAIDTYHMVACAIDEAIRNVIAVGASLEQIAGLDNFCWPDPIQSEQTPDGKYKAAQLVRACQALYDYTTGFGVPCISGKDSMKNDAVLDGQKISILPTLLFSVAGKVHDIQKCVTMDVKNPGDLVYLIGETYNELGGSAYYQLKKCIGTNVPQVNLIKAKQRYQNIYHAVQKKLIQSNHDCSEGGVAVALAEKAFAGGFGMELDITTAIMTSHLRLDQFLFSESQSRFVLTIKPENQNQFESIFAQDSFFLLGTVTKKAVLNIYHQNQTIIEEPISQLKYSWQKTLSTCI